MFHRLVHIQATLAFDTPRARKLLPLIADLLQAIQAYADKNALPGPLSRHAEYNMLRQLLLRSSTPTMVAIFPIEEMAVKLAQRLSDHVYLYGRSV